MNKKNTKQSGLFSIDEESILAILLLLFFLYNIFLFKDMPLEQYPYIFQDFWRRAVDSLYYLGQSSGGYFPVPVPSLLFARFLLIGGQFLYLLNYVCFCASTIFIFTITNAIVKNKQIALISALLFFFNFYVLHLFQFYGLVDGICTTLILATIHIWMTKTKSIKSALLVGILAGAAGLTQYIGIIVLPLLVIYDLVVGKFKKPTKKEVIFYIFTGILSLLIFSLFFIYRKIQFGDWTYTLVDQINYFKFHIDGIAYYLVQLLSIYSIAVLILAVIGIINAVKTLKVSWNIIVISAMFVPFFVFFAFFYEWKDIRFMIYSGYPIYLLAGIGIWWIYEKIMKKYNNKTAKLIGICSIILLFAYTNLADHGHTGIIYSPNSIITTDIEKGIHIETSDELFVPFYVYMIDINKRVSTNSELNYYANTVNPSLMKDLASSIDDIPKVELCIDFNDEMFVRTAQLSFYTKYPFPFVEVIDCAEGGYTYVLSDHAIEDASYTIFDSYKSFFVYEIEEK